MAQSSSGFPDPRASGASAGARLRWAVKKAARTSIALGSYTWDRARGFPGSGRVRVLMYHRVGARRRDAFSVTTAAFEAQMRWLAEEQLAVGPETLERVLDGTETLPADRVLVTFDDGWASLHTRALPILRNYAIPAVAFLSVGAIGCETAPTGTHDGTDDERALRWNEVAELRDAGVALGSHGWSHRSLTALPPPVAREEMTRARLTLEQFLGARVAWFAYPFGTRADYDSGVVQMVGESGHRYAFTAQHGAVTARLPRLILPRVKVEGGESLRMFRLICRGALDRWRWVDRTLWRLQARRT